MNLIFPYVCIISFGKIFVISLFVFVKDLAKIVLKACDGIGGGSYHFSSGKDISVLELYNAVVNAMKIKKYPNPEIKELAVDDVFSILLDPSKTFNDFGEIDWDEFWSVVKGGGPCNLKRLNHHKKAHNDGAWVRKAAAAHAKKQLNK